MGPHPRPYPQSAGLPPTEPCQWCGKPYPRVGISQHEASCPDNPANRPQEK